MTEVTVRKMREGDRTRVMAILAQWNMAPRPPTRDEPLPERSTIHIENTFVASIDDTVVGVGSYILGNDGMAETASLAVDPAYQGTGIGDRLQSARCAEMQTLGVHTLRTETDRPEVIAWYIRKFGYRIVGRNPKKHSFGLDDESHWTVLELNLRRWRADAVS